MRYFLPFKFADFFKTIIIFSLRCIKLVGTYIPATGYTFCSASTFVVIYYDSSRKQSEGINVCCLKSLSFGGNLTATDN